MESKKVAFKKKLLVSVFGLATMLGLGLMPGGAVLADDDEDDRFVVISGVGYSVEHDGDGPHIVVNGMKHYLEGDGGERFVVVGGRSFSVLGHDDDDHDDDDDDDKDKD